MGLLAYYWPPRPPFSDVLAAREQVDVLFAFMHWGKEDDPEPMQLQRTLSRQLIDAGVDMVVGTHAHVLQPLGWYRGKLIAFGLGNFVFSGMTDASFTGIGALLGWMWLAAKWSRRSDSHSSRATERRAGRRSATAPTRAPPPEPSGPDADRGRLHAGR